MPDNVTDFETKGLPKSIDMNFNSLLGRELKIWTPKYVGPCPLPRKIFLQEKTKTGEDLLLHKIK